MLSYIYIKKIFSTYQKSVQNCRRIKTEICFYIYLKNSSYKSEETLIRSNKIGYEEINLSKFSFFSSIHMIYLLIYNYFMDIFSKKSLHII